FAEGPDDPADDAGDEVHADGPPAVVEGLGGPVFEGPPGGEHADEGDEREPEPRPAGDPARGRAEEPKHDGRGGADEYRRAEPAAQPTGDRVPTDRPDRFALPNGEGQVVESEPDGRPEELCPVEHNPPERRPVKEGKQEDSEPDDRRPGDQVRPLVRT